MSQLRRHKLFLATLTLCGLAACSPGTGGQDEASTPSSLPPVGALTKAAGAGDLAKVQALLSAGASVNEDVGSDGNSLTPLLAATAHGHQDIAALLLRSGATSVPSYKGYRATDIALELELDDILKLSNRHK